MLPWPYLGGIWPISRRSHWVTRWWAISPSNIFSTSSKAPRLRKVQLHNAVPTSGAQNGRLVSLEYLKRMDIVGGGPSSLLLDHLLIPDGARLTTQVGPLSLPAEGSLVNGHLPGLSVTLATSPIPPQSIYISRNFVHAYDSADRTGKLPWFLHLPEPTPPTGRMNLLPGLTPRRSNG